jgi:site-specific recombinase XerD
MAKNQVLGEQMRMNQAQKAQVYGSNINTLNQAQLQNLQTYDTQQQRQEAAKSATKATTQEALNSISSKYAQNKLENKQLGVMENMYNFRYDKSGRAINMNPLAQFDTEVTGGSANSAAAPAGYEFETILKKKKAPSTKESRNGSIVKAIKNL